MNEQVDVSVDGARTAARSGDLGAWVSAFLSSPGSDNADLADSLDAEMKFWLGPMLLPFSRLHRLAGPPDQPTLEPLHSHDLEKVEDMVESVDDGWKPPPLIVAFRGSQLVLEDGNHRIESLRRSGEDEYWSVVGCADADQRERFRRDWIHPTASAGSSRISPRRNFHLA